MKQFVYPLAAFALLALANMVWAGGPVDGLNKEQLRKGVASRVEGAIKQKQPQADVDLGPSDVQLQRIEPTSVSVTDSEIPLYAIKAQVSSPVGKGQPSNVKMIVDRSGKLQLSVQDLATGKSLVQNAKDVINRKPIDPDMGQTVFEGDGSRDVLLVIDPFCGYCRKAVSWFMDHRENINTLRVLQVPFARKAGADVASWAFWDGSETVDSGKLLRFIYSSNVDPLGKDATEKDKSRILKHVMQEFPALKKKWGTPERGFYYLKGRFQKMGQKNIRIAQSQLEVKATPGVFVDGIPVKGWNPQRYGELLAEKQERIIE